MTKRRRHPQSLWLDSIQHSSFAKRLRQTGDKLGTSETAEKNSPTSEGIHTTANPELDRNEEIGVLEQYTEKQNPCPPKRCGLPEPCSPHIDCMEEPDKMKQDQTVSQIRGLTDVQESQFQPFEHNENVHLPDYIPSENDLNSEIHLLCSEAMPNSPSLHEYVNHVVEDHHRTTATEVRDVVNTVVDYDLSDDETLSASLQQNVQIWSNHLNLTAIVAVVGSVRYTVPQYEYTQGILQDAGENFRWPAYAKTQRHFRKIIEVCMPKSKLVKLPRNEVITRSLMIDEEQTWKKPQGELSASLGTETVRVFMPSSWAIYDVSTAPVFNSMFPSYHNRNQADAVSGLENSSIIRDRASITSSCDYIFANSEGRQVPCRPGSDIEISLQNPKPMFETAFHISAEDDTYILEATVAATWTVGSQGGSNSSSRRALSIQSLSSQQRVIIASLCTGTVPSFRNHTEFADPIPGDLCTLLASKSLKSHEDKHPVIVHRFWRYNIGMPSVILLWVHSPNPNSRPSAAGQSSLKVLESHIVEGVNLIRYPEPPNHGIYRHPGSKSYGTLIDGTPFVVYRILLYADDFRKSSAMYPKGSAGGSYFLPLSLPPETRRSTSSIRIISLTPPGVSTNQVLHYVVEDLVNASLHRVEGRTPRGKKVKIFIDVVGFLGDYPASASVVDVIGHVCGAPCTLCSFRRSQEAGAEGSRYGYTTDVHATNRAFMRYGERHSSLREIQIPNSDSNVLGMVAEEKYPDRTCPLNYLQRLLQANQSRSALADDGIPVSSTRSDAYRCNMVAPDHLLTGLAKHIINATFASLPRKELRK